MNNRVRLALRPCPICGAEQAEYLRKMRFVLPEGHPLETGYTVVCCTGCGFVYADTIVTQQDYDSFYAKFSKYEDSQTSTGGGGSQLDAERLRNMAVTIAKYLGDPAARILDVGCANGGLLGALRALGYGNLMGVDPSPNCVANTRRDYGIEAHAASLFGTLDDLGHFDCVILSHVLEHVQDLHVAAKAVAQRTAPGGVAYIEVPDATRYVDCLVAPFQDFNTEHINHFSTVSLTNLMIGSGFSVCETGTKTIWASPQAPYPALYGFFANTPAAVPGEMRQDRELRLKIAEYIAQSQAMLDAMDQTLRNVLARSPEVVVWGTGQLAMKLLVETVLKEAKILAFVDGNPINQGRLLRGVPILSPAEFARQGWRQPIIISTTLHSVAITDLIRTQLRLENELIQL